jgi:hypothetical protein
MTVTESGRLDRDSDPNAEPSRIEKLEELVEQLGLRLNALESHIDPLPAADDGPFENKCQACGIEWSGAMGYCCSRTDCPYGVTSTSFPHG